MQSQITKTQFTVSHQKSIDPEAVQDLCGSVGWIRREAEAIGRSLVNSLAVVSVWDDDLLVGLCRATGDKVFNATIWDVAVRPNYQRQGIGRLLMEELLAEIDSYGIPLVTLYADLGRDSFYRRFGFYADSNSARGMFREIDGTKL